MTDDITFSHELTAAPIRTSAADIDVVAAARVSTIGADSRYVLDDDPAEHAGLIRFLMKNRHGTPFEHNQFTFLVKAPIVVFREFHRHRIGWSYNEQSGRYSILEPEFYLPPEHRPLVQVGKPGHYTLQMGTAEQYSKLVGNLQGECHAAYERYLYLLDSGIAKEVARGVLPVYLYSAMYATCNARSLMSFLSLRTRDDVAAFASFPMWEIEQIARAMETEFARAMPITHAAFREFGSVAP